MTRHLTDDQRVAIQAKEDHVLRMARQKVFTRLKGRKMTTKALSELASAPPAGEAGVQDLAVRSAVSTSKAEKAMFLRHDTDLLDQVAAGRLTLHAAFLRATRRKYEPL